MKENLSEKKKEKFYLLNQTVYDTQTLNFLHWSFAKALCIGR